jgi:6-phosphofructokinase 1
MQVLRVFISYAFEDEQSVGVVAHLLRKQPGLVPYLYADEKRGDEWPRQLIDAINECDAFVYVAGKTEGRTQRLEANWHYHIASKRSQTILFVCLPGGNVPEDYHVRGAYDTVKVKPETFDAHESIARQVALRLVHTWTPSDGAPTGYLFDYEKDIVEAYVSKRLNNSALDIKLLESGCPADWPKVQKWHATHQNDAAIQEKFGTFRKETSAIAVDSRTSEIDEVKERAASAIRRTLTFPEAGPREWHRYPLEGQPELKVAILVSGGIAPGINAVIDGIVKRHEAYVETGPGRYELTIFGYREGLQSLVSEVGGRSVVKLTSREVERQAQMGGSLLATSRWDDFVLQPAASRDEMLSQAVIALRQRHIDILYVIGGDGSMRAAHALWKKSEELSRSSGHSPLSVFAIPKTMDNDILWVWQSFGFLTAVEKAREAVLNLHTEARSNPRLCILQLFGSDSGFVAAHAALASGVADVVMIPEVDYSMEGLYKHIEHRLKNRYSSSPHALVVMAETALPLDALKYVEGVDEPAAPPELRVILSGKEVSEVRKFFSHNRRVTGQTPDGLRTAGLKIVSGVLQAMIKQRMKPTEYWSNFRVFPNEPRHLIRSVPPSTSDVIFAERLGALAVDNAMAGYTDCIVSQWLTEFVLVPLELVILGRKRVPPDGVFWKSVLLSTGQPARMVERSPVDLATGAGAQSLQDFEAPGK